MEQAERTSAVDSDVELREEIEKIIGQREQTTHQNSDSPFFLVDLRKIKHQYLKWKSLMHRVELFYAVKVCPEVSVLKLLADMGSSFDCASQMTKKVNACLDKYFPVNSGIRIIAEPGSFVATTAFTLVLQVVGKRSNETSEKGIVYEMRQQRTVAPRFLYYVNDGRYGSVSYEIATLSPIQALSRRKGKNTTYSSVLFGPTCDGFDVLYSDISLPELYIGDWLYLENAGAYSVALASDFNMMPRAEFYYVSLDTNNER